MRTDEEELLIYSIRSGTVRYKNILIVPATIDQIFFANQIYVNSYTDCVDKGIMTDNELEVWMVENSILPKSFFATKKSLLSSIDSHKKNLFRNRFSKRSIKLIKSELKNTRAKLNDLLKPKLEMSQNTCEFISQTNKLIYLLKKTTLEHNKPYRAENYNKIIEIWNSSLLSEHEIRRLARSNAWKSIWSNKGFGFDLFKKRKNADLTINQRNLLTWSKIYDNIQESLECPSEAVIEDDDILDGWFLIQKDKREQERIKQESESLSVNTRHNSKMSNASHVFMANMDPDSLSVMNQGSSDLDIQKSLLNRNK